MQYGNRLLFKVSAIVTLLLLMVLGSVQGDTVVGTIATITNNPATFNASGTLTTTDTANAAPIATPPNDGVDGPTFFIPTPAPGAAAAGPWELQIRHRTNPGVGNPHWVAAGAKDLQVCIEGIHVTGPHPPPPPADVNPNNLGLACGKKRDLPFGAAGSGKRSAYMRQNHPTAAAGNHFDHYGVLAVTSALPNVPGNQITGVYDVSARHTTVDDKPSDMSQYALGSSANAGTTVAYDHNTRRLRFSIGAIDILDSSGGRPRAIDELYAEDPIVAGKLTVSDLVFIEKMDDGRFRFGGGEVVITDPAGKFDFNGAFSKYSIDETVGGPRVTSFALLDSLAINDVAEGGGGASRFLDEFVRVNILGKGIPEAQWLRTQGFDLTFLTGTDLVAKTNNFTQSAELPATVLIALNEVAEEEVTDGGKIPRWILIAIGLLVIAVLILIISRAVGRTRS